jgi:hypothetical protein
MSGTEVHYDSVARAAGRARAGSTLSDAIRDRQRDD